MSFSTAYVPNQEAQRVGRGTAEVLAPTERCQRLEEVYMPEIRIDDKHGRYTHLCCHMGEVGWNRSRPLSPHPATRESLKGPVIAFQEGIIRADLIGPENKIRSRSPRELASTCTASASSMPRTVTRLGGAGGVAGCAPATPGADERQPAPTS